MNNNSNSGKRKRGKIRHNHHKEDNDHRPHHHSPRCDEKSIDQVTVISEESNPELFFEIEVAFAYVKEEEGPSLDIVQARERAPVASFRLAENPPTSFFVQPTSYVHYREITPEEIDLDSDKVEYEVDSEDEHWIEGWNKKHPDLIIKEDTFEFIMDKLEKEAFKRSEEKAEIVRDEPEDPIEQSDCCVCNEGMSEDSNQIVFCDGCDLAVHQCCYGISVIPEGEWYCKVCLKKGPGTAQFENCILCPEFGGAMKEIDEVKGDWIHIQCAQYCPEIEFEQPDCGGKVLWKEPLKLSPQSQNCIYCKKKMGNTVRCSSGGCSERFHVTCGLLRRLVMLPSDGQSIKSSFQFCDKHTPNDFKNSRRLALKKDKVLRKKREEKQKFPIPDMNLTEPPREDETRFCGGLDIDIVKKIFFHEPVNALPSPDIIIDIFSQWSNKRTRRRGMPLLRRFSPAILNSAREADTSRSSALLNSKVSLQKLTDTTRRLVRWRQQLETIRTLTELVKKREAYKYRSAILMRDMFETEFLPNLKFARLMLQHLKDEDKYGYFSAILSWEKYPEYPLKVEKPLDFVTFERLLNTKQYNSINAFMDDINFMFENALSIYKEGSIQCTEVNRLKNLANFWKEHGLPADEILPDSICDLNRDILDINEPVSPKPTDTPTRNIIPLDRNLEKNPIPEPLEKPPRKVSTNTNIANSVLQPPVPTSAELPDSHNNDINQNILHTTRKSNPPNSSDSIKQSTEAGYIAEIKNTETSSSQKPVSSHSGTTNPENTKPSEPVPKPKDDFVFEKPLPVIFPPRNKPTNTTPTQPLSTNPPQPVHDPFIRPVSLKNIPHDQIKSEPNTIKSSPLKGDSSLPRENFFPEIKKPHIIDVDDTETDGKRQLNPSLPTVAPKEDTRYERKKIRKKVIITEIRYQNTQKGRKEDSSTSESSSSSSKRKKRKSKDRQWTVTRKKRFSMTTTKERTRKISSKRKRNNSDSDSSPSPRPHSLKKERREKTEKISKSEKTENTPTQDSIPRSSKPWQNNGTYVDMDVKSNSLLIVFDFRKIVDLMSTEDREKYLPFLQNSEKLLTV